MGLEPVHVLLLAENGRDAILDYNIIRLFWIYVVGLPEIRAKQCVDNGALQFGSFLVPLLWY